MTIIKATKLPITIEAVQWLGDNHEEITSFMLSGGWTDKSKKEVYILTLEGIMVAKVGDYIIKGIKGEYYPCKPEVFEATYSIEPKNFLDRMKEEYSELEAKLNKLASFIESGKTLELSYNDRNLLNEQYTIMRRYASILGQRILSVEEQRKPNH